MFLEMCGFASTMVASPSDRARARLHWLCCTSRGLRRCGLLYKTTCSCFYCWPAADLVRSRGSSSHGYHSYDEAPLNIAPTGNHGEPCHSLKMIDWLCHPRNIGCAASVYNAASRSVVPAMLPLLHALQSAMDIGLWGQTRAWVRGK